jgi:hypothetical protein
MGYAPDWNKGSMKKTGATPVKHGVTSRELFHGAKQVQHFYDGGAVESANPSGSDMKYTPVPDTGELNIKGEKVGYYTGNDEIVKYRMKMTDDVGGKSLRVQDQTVAPDFEGGMEEAAPKKENAEPKEDAGRKFLASQVKKAPTNISSPTTSSPKLKNETARLAPQDPRDEELESPGARMSKATGTRDTRTVTAYNMNPSDSELMADRMKVRMDKTSAARKPSTLNVSKYRQEKAPAPMHNEADGSYEQLRQPKKSNLYYGKK